MVLTIKFACGRLHAMKIKNQVALNIRFLLWQKGVEKTSWSEVLSEWIDCKIPRAVILLDQGDMLIEEIECLSERVKVSKRNILHSKLYLKVNIFSENIKYLFNSIGHGGQQKIAQELQLDPTTISRWKNGTLKKPGTRNHNLLKKHFHLSEEIDLCDHPIFLSNKPITIYEKKTLLIDGINSMDSSSLKDLFPALIKLINYK